MLIPMTPTQINTHEFTTRGGLFQPESYDADEVDDFLDRISLDVYRWTKTCQQLSDTCKQLQKELALLQAQLEVFNASADDE